MLRLLPVFAAVVLLALGAYWLATGARPRSETPDWLTERPFAHRGLHDGPDRPENSVAAFEAALAAGHPIELDVQLSADGTVVVFHDDDLERMTGDPRTVSEVTDADLATLRLAGTEQRIPTLAESLELIGDRVPVLVEVKNRSGSVGPLEDAVAEVLLGYEGRSAVMSFNPLSLWHIRRSAPQLIRGQLSGTFADEDLRGYQVFALRRLLMNWAGAPHFIGYDANALPSVTARLQRLRGRPLLAWTIDDAATAQRVEPLADNIICDPGGLPAP